MPIEFPNVDCAEHPGLIEPGYLICDHIQSPEDIFYSVLATKEKLGVICCETCLDLSDNDEYSKKFLHIICAQGLRERGWLIEA